MTRIRRGTWVCAAVGALIATLVPAAALVSDAAAAGSGTPPFIPAAAGWLQSVNYYRAMSGLAPVSEDANLDPGAVNHSCYMLQNDIAHDEITGNPGYTASGDQAGNHGNVAVSSVFNSSERSFIELWMTGPFHAIGVLRPGLRTVGFGKCDRTDTPKWHSGATLDVLDGLVNQPPPSQPILFPGNGMTTSLNRFVVESPNPLDACQWTGSAGLPVMALMPESTAGATGTISGPNGPIETCVVSAANTTGVANQILAGDNVVVVIPRVPLVDGSYQVGVHTNARDANWTSASTRRRPTGRRRRRRSAGPTRSARPRRSSPSPRHGSSTPAPPSARPPSPPARSSGSR